MNDLSILIVSHNTCDLLRACLESLAPGCAGLRYHTWMIDNASHDGSADMVAREFSQVTLLRNHRDVGFAAANNQALERAAASSRYVVLLNPDTVVRDNSLGQLAAFMDERPRVGYCGPRLLNEDGSHQVSAGRFLTILSDPLSVAGLARNPHSRHTMNLHLLHGDTATFPIDWLFGACLMVRSQAVEQVGLLDEGYFLYYEDLDWCRRLARAGWEGWYVGSSEVTHLGGRSVVHHDDSRPFWGHHPVWHVRSYRRYMRRTHGKLGMWASYVLLTVAYTLVWLRNIPPFGDRNPRKARDAAAAVGYLLGRSSNHDRRHVEPVPPHCEENGGDRAGSG